MYVIGFLLLVVGSIAVSMIKLLAAHAGKRRREGTAFFTPETMQLMRVDSKRNVLSTLRKLKLKDELKIAFSTK